MRVPPEAAKQPPTVLVKWYDWLRWLLGRVDSFPKNQRFIFGTRLADRAIGVLELLLEAAYSTEKQQLLARANREIEVLRWLVRLQADPSKPCRPVNGYPVHSSSGKGVSNSTPVSVTR